MADQPNIILINCDDLGYGDLGCYGSTANKTPYLDKMAEEGRRFTDFYMASPVCSPSRAAMMTGCYPPRIGLTRVLFPGDATGLNPDEITVAKLLKGVGYNTMLVGKWHCGDQPEFLPTNHGFDHYYGIPYSNDMGMQREEDDKDKVPPLPLMNDDTVIQEQPDQTSVTERYVEQGVRFIRDNKENPFFLYFAHMHVHLPHYVADHFMKQSENGPYGAAVECIDWSIGVILDELKEQGIDDNTLVIFTSDNGSRERGEGGSNAPLRGTKFTTWEGGLRVPCIMRWPSKIPAGTEHNGITLSMDFYPTFANIAGAALPTDRTIDGKDIQAVMTNGEESPQDTFFYYTRNNLEAVRHENWKLHTRKNKESINELYNLESDVSESNNVYADNPEVVEKLSALLDACRDDIGDKVTDKTGRDTRPIGKVENPDTLTHYDPNHPYIIALYDLKERG